MSQKGPKQTQGGQITELATAQTENTAGCLVARDIPRKKHMGRYNDREREQFNCHWSKFTHRVSTPLHAGLHCWSLQEAAWK